MIWKRIIAHQPNRTTVARVRSRRPAIERLEGRALPASYTAASVVELIDFISAADARGGADTFAAAVGRPPAPGYSLAGRGLPSLDTYVYSDGSSSTLASTYDAKGNLTGLLFVGYDADGVE